MWLSSSSAEKVKMVLTRKMAVCVCTRARERIYIQVYLLLWAHVDARSWCWNIFFNSIFNFHLFVFIETGSLIEHGVRCLNSLPRTLQGHVHLSPQFWDCKGVCYTHLFTWILELLGTQVVMPAKLTLYPPSHLLALKSGSFEMRQCYWECRWCQETGHAAIVALAVVLLIFWNPTKILDQRI